MCAINKEGRPCKYEIRLDQFGILSHSDTNGYCVFHSENLVWKRSVFFETTLIQLTEAEIIAEQRKYLDFEGVIFDESINTLLHLDWKNRHMVLDNCIIHSDVKVVDVEWRGTASLKGINVNGKVSFNNVTLDGVNFDSAIIQKDIFLTNVVSKSYFYLNNTNIHGSLSIVKTTFEHILSVNHTQVNSNPNHIRHTIINNCDFKRVVEFENTTFNKAFVFKESLIYDRFSFLNTRFNCDFTSPIFSAVFISRNTIFERGHLSFIGTKEGKMFDESTDVIVTNNDIKGEMLFEYCNLQKMKNADKQQLLDASRDSASGVNIGVGCLKYRLQSPIKVIKANFNTDGIIQELSTSFTNYFVSSNGFNLGVEFVSKEIHEIKLFYYSDENIPLETFYERLRITEERYWALSISENAVQSKDQMLGIIDAYISKLSILSKIKLRKKYSNWTTEDLIQVMSALNFSGNLINAQGLNLHIENLHIDAGLTIEQQVNHGGSHQFADTIHNNSTNDNQ